MKNPQTQRTKTPLWLAAAAAVVAPVAGFGELTIHYNFEDMTADPSPGDSVLNIAPDAFVPPGAPDGVNGTWSIAGFPLLLQNQQGKFGDGKFYSLGNAMDIQGGDHIETNFFLSDVNIFGNTNYTVMAWMNVLNGTGDHMLFGTVLGPQRLHLGTRDGHLHSGHWGDDTSGTNANDPGTWHHVTYIGHASGLQEIYRDGEKVADDGLGRGAVTHPVDDMLLIGMADAPGRAYAGAFDEVKVFVDTILTPEQIRAEAVAGLPLVPVPSIQSITGLSRTAVEIIVQDFDATTVVDPSTIGLEIDFVGPVPPTSVTKDGDLTTIVYDSAPVEPDPYTEIVFFVTGETTTGVSFEESTSIRTPAFPSVLRTGLAAPPNDGSWQMLEWAGAALAGGEQAYRDALATIADTTFPPTAEATVPYVNHSDPDSPGDRAQFHPDFPAITDIPGNDDNNYVTLARSVQNIAPGQEGVHTIHIDGDDGYGIRITNLDDAANDPTFIGVFGAGPNAIDQQSPNTALHPLPTGNSNAFLQINFPVPGNYLVEWIGWENGGGAYQEISWVAGAFTSFDVNQPWRLMGDGSPLETVSIRGEIPQSIKDGLRALAEASAVPGWAVNIFYDTDRAGDRTVDNVNEAMDFTRQYANGTAFASVHTGVYPTLNFTDGGDGDFGGGVTWPEPDDPLETSTVDDFIMVAYANLHVEEGDDYTIRVRTDDGFLLRFENKSTVFTSETGNAEIHPGARYELIHPGNTGNSDALGVVNLPAGNHEVFFVFWERGGGANAEIAAIRGAQTTFSASDFTLIGDTIDTTPKPTIRGIGTTAEGWTVTTTPPNLKDPLDPGLDFFFNGRDLFIPTGEVLALTEDAFNADPTVRTMHDYVNFRDTGGFARVPDTPVPFTNDTPGDENQFAMVATATLDITEAGIYYIGFQGDDGGSVRVVGQDLGFAPAETAAGATIIEGDPLGAPGVFDMLVADVNTGNSFSIAEVTLEVGQYTIETQFFEIAGGAYHAVFGAAPGSFTDDLYEFGARFIPIGVGAAGRTFQAPSGGLELALPGDGPTEEEPFEITSITRNGAGDVTLVFDSQAGVFYVVKMSVDAKDWTAEGADLQGAAAPAVETEVTIPFFNIINGFGAPPGDEVLFRVEEAE